MKRTIKSILCIVTIAAILSISVCSVFAGNFSAGQCTWWADLQFHKPDWDPIPYWQGTAWQGNGGQWPANASALGWPVSYDPTCPMAGATISWDGGTNNYGHVAYVVAVFSDGSIEISEANWDYPASQYGTNDIDYKVLTLDQIKARGTHKFVGYVYPIKPR